MLPIMSDDHSRFDGLSSLISFTGVSVPARARFVAKSLASSLYSSLTLGLVAGQTGALLSCGPLLPFLAGSWLGYTYGLVAFWRQAKTKAINCARRYPKILAHSLLLDFDVEVPKDVSLERSDGSNEDIKEGKYVHVEKVCLEDWILDGGIGRISYAVLAAQSCDEDIIDMQKSERQRLVDSYTDGE